MRAFPQAPLYSTHALFEAARYGCEDIIDMLLKCEELDVNQPAVRARVPLGWLEMEGRVVLVVT